MNLNEIESVIFFIFVGFICGLIGAKMGLSIGRDSVCEQIKYENKWNAEEVRYCADWEGAVDKAGTK